MRNLSIAATAIGLSIGWATAHSAAAAQECPGVWEEVGGGLTNNGSLWIPEGPVEFDDGSGPGLFIAGGFTLAGDIPVENFAKWDGSSWSAPLGGGLPGMTWVLLPFDDGSGPSMFVGGEFKEAGGKTVNNVARWDGSAWHSLGTGMGNDASPHVVSAMTAWDPDGDGPLPMQLVVGGGFHEIGGIAASHVAMWDGQQWSAMGDGLPSGGWAMVYNLVVFDDGTGPVPYASFFGNLAQGVFRWKGSVWEQVGEPFYTDYDMSLGVFDDGQGTALYAAGDFAEIGDKQVRGFARWTGADWEEVGGGILPNWAHVDGLFSLDYGTGPTIVIVGQFNSVGGQPAQGIAAWNGEEWDTLAGGVSGGEGLAFGAAVWDDGSGPALYAAGPFTNAGGFPAKGVAKYTLCAPCAADCDGSGGLDLFDFLCFVNRFNAGDPGADCTGDGGLDLFDFLCFVNAFNAGC